jgi:hypothetical protein
MRRLTTHLDPFVVGDPSRLPCRETRQPPRERRRPSRFRPDVTTTVTLPSRTTTLPGVTTTIAGQTVERPPETVTPHRGRQRWWRSPGRTRSSMRRSSPRNASGSRSRHQDGSSTSPAASSASAPEESESSWSLSGRETARPARCCSTATAAPPYAARANQPGRTLSVAPSPCGSQGTITAFSAPLAPGRKND